MQWFKQVGSGSRQGSNCWSASGKRSNKDEKKITKGQFQKNYGGRLTTLIFSTSGFWPSVAAGGAAGVISSGLKGALKETCFFFFSGTGWGWLAPFVVDAGCWGCSILSDTCGHCKYQRRAFSHCFAFFCLLCLVWAKNIFSPKKENNLVCFNWNSNWISQGNDSCWWRKSLKANSIFILTDDKMIN